MELARHIRTLLVFGTAASLMTLGAFLGNDAVAQAPPECPRDWPGQGYEGPLRSEDYGRNQHENFHTDADGQRWYVIRSSDSNGYTTIRAYPASDDADGGYHADSPDQVCYLIVRKPGAETDAAEPDQVVFPREREPRDSPTTPSRPVPRPPTAVSEQHTAGAEAVVEHPDGVQVRIPEAATAGTPSDEHSWTPGSAITEESDDGNDRMVTVSIQAIDPPEGNVLEGGQVYNISFTDDDGDDVHLRQPVTLTLPYTLPDGKTASDVVVLHWDQQVRRWESAE